MSLKPEPLPAVPEAPARLAHTVCPQGGVCIWIGEDMNTVVQDEPCASFFPRRGQPAEAPWRLALVTVLHCVEGLSDRQAAEAVRTRIDWNDALHVEREDRGVDVSVRCECRARRLQSNGEALLFETLRSHAKERGWLKARGRQRTDSTHVLAAIHTLSRLECVAETLRQARTILSTTMPDWVHAPLPTDWDDRYATRWQDDRLPSGRQERQELADMIGRDGHQLVALLQEEPTLQWIWHLPAVETRRRVWVQQETVEEAGVDWREANDVPPSSLVMCTP